MGKDDEGKNIKIGIVSVLTLAAIIFGFFFMAFLNHEARLSKTEANQEYVVKGVDEIKCNLKELDKKIGEIRK